MQTRFLQDSCGEVYRVLLQDGVGAWLISHTQPAQPFFVTAADLSNMKRIPMPDDYGSPGKETKAHKQRLELIRPLLDDESCVTDKAHRKALVKALSEQNNTTERRILRLYYRYLATGTLIDFKGKPAASREDYDWAIKTFYYSAKRMSLRTSYDLMLLQRFTDSSGQLLPGAPTWSSYQHYFYSRNYHKMPRKIISREGLSSYQRNHRPVFGSASDWRPEPGAYQMDATIADIYLVSRHDRSSVIGRPYVYLAVDTATQLIAGVYVGLESGETAVMQCLAQAAADKVSWCRSCGVDIDAADWPNAGLPLEVISDKGGEFFGGRMQELCRRYGIEIQSLPPFRPDQKGLVEKSFDLIQQRYKPQLRGKGVIEEDAQERWATDYRSQATLTLDEFTQVVIHCIIYLNNGRLLPDGQTAAQKWNATAANLLDVPVGELQIMALPRTTAKLTRKGFRVNRLLYVPVDMDGLVVGDTYTVAFSPDNLSAIYVVLDAGNISCHLAASDNQYNGLSTTEVDAARTQSQESTRSARQREMEASTTALQNIQAVVKQAKEKGGASGKQDGKAIQENRAGEKGRLSK